jgi:hypothetical protein
VKCPRCEKEHEIEKIPLKGKHLELKGMLEGEWYSDYIFESYGICVETGQPVFPIKRMNNVPVMALAC